MTDPTHFFVVMRLDKWTSFETVHLPGISVKGPDESIGCLCVYPDRETAEKHNPGWQVIEIQESPGKPDENVVD